MKVSAATRARRRDSGRTGHQLPTAMANRLAWDVILACGPTIGGYPVVSFQGRYYLADPRAANPWPSHRGFCRLLARPGDPLGDLAITEDGMVSKWSADPGRRWERKRQIVGVQEDVQPVLSLPVAGAGATT